LKQKQQKQQQQAPLPTIITAGAASNQEASAGSFSAARFADEAAKTGMPQHIEKPVAQEEEEEEEEEEQEQQEQQQQQQQQQQEEGAEEQEEEQEEEEEQQQEVDPAAGLPIKRLKERSVK
jgi:hypothetical protein